MSEYTGVGSTGDEIDKVVHSIVFDVALKAAMAVAFAEVPFLGWPVVKDVVMYVVAKLMGLVYDQLSRFVAFTVIEIQTDAQRAAYDSSVQALRQVISVPKEDQDAKAVADAKAEFRRRLADLIHFPK